MGMFRVDIAMRIGVAMAFFISVDCTLVLLQQYVGMGVVVVLTIGTLVNTIHSVVVLMVLMLLMQVRCEKSETLVHCFSPMDFYLTSQ
jgi:uncharacterized membrane protein YgaE (UPF0421/DUF939 family)